MSKRPYPKRSPSFVILSRGSKVSDGTWPTIPLREAPENIGELRSMFIAIAMNNIDWIKAHMKKIDSSYGRTGRVTFPVLYHTIIAGNFFKHEGSTYIIDHYRGATLSSDKKNNVEFRFGNLTAHSDYHPELFDRHLSSRSLDVDDPDLFPWIVIYKLLNDDQNVEIQCEFGLNPFLMKEYIREQCNQ